jgi:Domain of unknown function (DUF4251)
MNRIITSFLFSVFAATALAQENEVSSIRQAIETKNFIFKASSATPQRGRMRQLTSEYELVVRPDTLISFLPYFGRAFTAPLNPSDGGIKFISTDFAYSVGEKKKRSWEIQINPKDVSDVTTLYLTIFDNGSASLRVNSINRTTIYFNGFAGEGNPVEKKAF